MPPKPKVQLDKGAWQWADTTDHTQVNEEHVRTAYRLDLPTCEKGACKRNCKGNPFCLNSLGEKSWFQPLDETKLQTFDHNEERREEGHFVGLKNLGATCYVNTFLQLWFHNPAVRKAIYEWRDPAFPDEYYPGWKPDSICGLLQVIFALLHGSIRRYVDPSPLIECLGLNTAEQQDAQEFSKLFLHVLESALSDSTSHRENIIEKQFCGSYVYVTECQNCRSQSERPATFYELDLNIRGHSTLAASIKDFLQEEKLEGDNQYMCSVCNSKQNAKRAIRLRKLPEVLNLQLLRFVFDKNKGHKKKLSSFIQFPETLDMSPFMQSSSGVGEQPTLYELAAVLIHRGPTAYSGHYIAHIREHETDSWYKFNDEEIEKMNNRKLELGKEEDNLDAGSSEKAPKASKGNHSSRNAYMLVYRLKGKEDDSHLPAANSYESALPEAVKGYVLNDNQEFENYVSEQLHVQEQSICDQKQKHEEIKMIYENLSVKSRDESWEWVTTQWLSNWLASPHASEKVKNKLFKCPHGKLRADDVVKMKCISTKGAEMLFSKYPINERFPGIPSLCEKCVVRHCREIRTKLFMADDDKLFSSVKNITFSEENETYYWVSRKHLRSWKRFALCEIDAQPISQAGLSGNGVEHDDLDETPLISTSTEVVGSSGEASCSNTFDGTETSRKGDIYPAADTRYNSLSSPSTSPPQRKWIPLCSPSHQEQPQPSSSFMSSSPPPPSPSSHSAAAAPSHPCTGSSTYFSNSSNQNPQRTYSCGNSQSMDLDTEIPPLVNSLSPTLGETNTSRKRKSPSPIESTQNATQTLHQVVLENNSLEHSESPDSGTVTLRTSCDANESLNHVNGFEKEDMDQFLEGEENGSHERETGRTEEVQYEDVEEKFNSDILCQHGNLKIDPSGRRLVTERVWLRLLYYFPHLKPYTLESDVCIECWREQEQEQQLKNSLRQEKQGQKELLQNLYHGKSRPRILDNWAGQTAYVVCTSFIEGWKKFVKHSMVNDSVQEIVNTPLLCQHKLLVYKPEDMNSPDNFTRFTLVWENEWETLTKYYHYDVEIQVLQIPEEDHGLYTVVTIPEVCTCCLEERLKQEEEGKFLFSSQIIYIRKILEGGAGDAAADGGKENGKGYNYDPEFSAPPLQKASKGRTHEDAPPEKQMRLNSNGGGSSSSSSLRKSNRHRKTRGEKEVTVSSTMTLKQLQKELFKLYSVLPMDQNLSLDGRSLNNVDATLQDLRVYPQCVIFLKADEPTSHTPSTVDDYLTVPTTPEEGFKGTNLLGR